DRHRPCEESRDCAAEQICRNIDWRNINVLQRPIALTILEDRKGSARHHCRNVNVESVSQIDVSVDGRLSTDTRYCAVHKNENQHARNGLQNRKSEEYERVRPVGFNLPAEPCSWNKTAAEISDHGGPLSP